MKNITLTEKQEWFIKCAIEAKDAVLPLNKNSLDDEQFKKDYFFTKSEIEEEINKLKLNIDKAITTMGLEAETEPLLPCPFCGGEADIKQNCRNGYYLKCKKCLIGLRQRVLHYSMEWLRANMIKTWNKRHY